MSNERFHSSFSSLLNALELFSYLIYFVGESQAIPRKPVVSSQLSMKYLCSLKPVVRFREQKWRLSDVERAAWKR